jgi:hypothetical protein
MGGVLLVSQHEAQLAAIYPMLLYNITPHSKNT